MNKLCGLQDDSLTGSKSTVAAEAPTSAGKAAVKAVNNAASQAASKAGSEAASAANTEAAAKAAAKRAKKQRQKAKKQQEQAAHQLQQQKPKIPLKQATQQVSSPEASSSQSFCGAVSINSCSSTEAAPATTHQACGDKLVGLTEVSAATATSQVLPPEAAGQSATKPTSASGEQAVWTPQLHPDTPTTFSHNTYKGQMQQNCVDSAESPFYTAETFRPTVEGHASEGASRVCSRELPCCDLEHSLDSAHMPGTGPDRGDQSSTPEKQPTPQLFCCPITKVPLLLPSPVLFHTFMAIAVAEA